MAYHDPLSGRQLPQMLYVSAMWHGRSCSCHPSQTTAWESRSYAVNCKSSETPCCAPRFILSLTTLNSQFVPLNGYIVAATSLLMSARFSTFMAVIQITLMSVHKVQWSTYQTSNLNFSVQLMVLRPWHWVHPLIPGRTS